MSTTKDILAKVMADLKKLTPEQLQAEMEAAKTSDWYKIFSDMEDQGLHLYMGPMPGDPKESSDAVGPTP